MKTLLTTLLLFVGTSTYGQYLGDKTFEDFPDYITYMEVTFNKMDKGYVVHIDAGENRKGIMKDDAGTVQVFESIPAAINYMQYYSTFKLVNSINSEEKKTIIYHFTRKLR